MDLIIQGIQWIFSNPINIMYFFTALFGGLFFGAVPGISVVTLGAIILPFTAYLDTAQALMIYGVMYCSGTFGGAVMAILFNIPGAPENAPTAFDGYPLTKKGKAGLAIGTAVSCSAIGGILSSVGMMLGTDAIARWAIRSFGPPEMFAVIFCGCAVAATVGASSTLKGWISLFIGLLLSTVGQDPVGGISRYTFGVVGLPSPRSFPARASPSASSLKSPRCRSSSPAFPCSGSSASTCCAPRSWASSAACCPAWARRWRPS